MARQNGLEDEQAGVTHVKIGNLDASTQTLPLQSVNSPLSSSREPSDKGDVAAANVVGEDAAMIAPTLKNFISDSLPHSRFPMIRQHGRPDRNFGFPQLNLQNREFRVNAEAQSSVPNFNSVGSDTY